MFKVFYSWQSDLPSNTNRGFIDDALRKACKALKADGSIAIEPVIDRDTLGLPGAPDITDAIFTKIREADVFVADVSLVNVFESGLADTEPPSRLIGRIERRVRRFIEATAPPAPHRPTPNPNVLTELGYALAHLGTESLVLVANTYYGDPKFLPFDLRQLRTLTYRSSPEDSDRSAARKRLAGGFEDAIRNIAAAVRSDPVYEIIYPRTLNVAGQAEGVLSELIKAAGKPFTSASITKDELAVVCAQINPNGQAPLVIGGSPGHFVYATWLSALGYWRDRSQKFTSNVLVFASFLRKEHVALLATIEQSHYFNIIDTFRAQQIGSTELVWLSEEIWNYLIAARRLREYAEKHLARRARKF